MLVPIVVVIAVQILLGTISPLNYCVVLVRLVNGKMRNIVLEDIKSPT